MRRVIRAALTLALAASLIWGGWNAWCLSREWPASQFTDRAQQSLTAELERQLARAASDGRLVARFETLLDEDPRNWLAIDAVQAEAARQSLPLPPELIQKRARLHADDYSLTNSAQSCAACAWDPKECALSSILVCRVAVDLTPVGDIAGVLREGGNYALGHKVDQFDLALSVVGLAAVAAAPATAGSSALIKGGAGVVKMARGMGRLPDGLTRPMIRVAREGVDWAKLPAARSTDDVVALVRPAQLRVAQSMLGDAGRLHKTEGLGGTLHLLAFADDPATLTRLARISDAIPARSVGAIEILGQSRLLRATRRWSDEIIGAVAATAAALSSLLGMLGSVVTTRVLRRARRATQRRR